MTVVSLVQFSLYECHWDLLMMSQHWFRYWLGAVRQQAITWINVDPDLSRHMVSLGHNELMYYLMLLLVVNWCQLPGWASTMSLWIDSHAERKLTFTGFLYNKSAFDITLMYSWYSSIESSWWLQMPSRHRGINNHHDDPVATLVQPILPYIFRYNHFKQTIFWERSEVGNPSDCLLFQNY